MSRTYNEIVTQYQALSKTYDHIKSKKESFIDFFKSRKKQNIVFSGCGSSYLICKSLELFAKMHGYAAATALAAGDLMINYEKYKNILSNSVIFICSRSGSTTETINSAKICKQNFNSDVVSLCCTEKSFLSYISDYVVEIPWAFDESVCQTRSVVNMYACFILLFSYLLNLSDVLNDVQKIIDNGSKFIKDSEYILKDIAYQDWDDVVLLADGSANGMVQEGALAFIEISKVPARCYNILDVRHGPIALIKQNTLVIIYGNEECYYQDALIKDIYKKTSKIILYLDKNNKTASDICKYISIDICLSEGARVIPFMSIPYLISYFKAEKKLLNPDLADDVEAWVKL